MAADANTRLAELIESAPKSVAGERLNVELLRRFYARRGFAPVWETRQAQANSLMDAISRAGAHGLAPELFHADVLLSPATLPSLDRELLLSSAFLSYADALARGAMPVERRRDDETLTPEPVDVAAVLDAAIASPDPAAVIEGLAPTTPTYRKLRQALQDKTATTRLREVRVNLERERWLPRRLPADRVWVNVADGRLVLYRDDQPVFSTRVIVGMDERRNQSPELQASIDGIWFNPPWNVPKDIAEGILAKARLDPTYLARHNMVMLPDGGLQQRGGGNSALGQLMFHMKNRFDVYLHDTPSKNLFGRDDRRFSHGCIRVEDPRKLAALLMQQPIEAINESIATGSANWGALPKPVPVFVVYETAFADGDGALQFRADIYGRDAEISQHLDPKRRAVADRKAPDQRGR
jgi:L,D-transpeptidase YcbB